MRLVDLSSRCRLVLLALGALASGCSDGLAVPGDTPSDDAAVADAAQAVALDSTVSQVGDTGVAAWLDASSWLPDAGVHALLEAGLELPDSGGNVLYPCQTRLAHDSFALDPSDCASRPVEACPGPSAARAKWLVEPSDYIADALFEECGKREGSYPVGITFNEQGCADKFYSLPFPESDALLQCYLRVLQGRRYPCAIRCSNYFRLD